MFRTSKAILAVTFVLMLAVVALATEWSYEGPTGPDHWGELSKEFALCADGSSQSPIDIADSLISEQDLQDIEFFYNRSELAVLNNGHTIEVEYQYGSYIDLDEYIYDLVQFHFHAPSEHTLNGVQFAMEMHLVHRNIFGELAVVGVMIREGEANERFEELWANLPREAGQVIEAEEEINADDLLPEARMTYRYAGSLTTPPCSEGVRWNLMAEPIELSREQIALFKEVLSSSCCPHNNRPVQPLNDRKILLDNHED